MSIRNRNGHVANQGGGFKVHDEIPIGLNPTSAFTDEFQRMEASSADSVPYSTFDSGGVGGSQRPGFRFIPRYSGSAAAGVTTAANSIAVITSLVLVGLALTAILINSIILGTNVRSLHNDFNSQQHSINNLQTEINQINASLPVGNGTVFFDDDWWMANGPHPGRQFQLNASLITGGTVRNYAGPDADGIILLDTTINPVFPEDQFAVVGDPDSTTRIEFDLSLIPSATLHLYSWPNKDGTVAMLSDIVAAVSGNETVFLDNKFALVNYIDTTKRAQFDASLITVMTNRTFSFPDLNGILALTTGAQTLSDKTIDNSNSITVVDSNLAIEASAGGNSVLFNADALSTDRTVAFPNLAGTFVLTAGTQTLSDKIIDNSNSITVVDSNFAIEDTAGGNSALFNANSLSVDQTFSFPDLTGTFVLTTGAQTVSGKTLDDTNSMTVVDSNFIIEAGVGGYIAVFNANNLTNDHVYTFQDKNCILACTSDIINIVASGTWAPNYTGNTGYTGFPTTVFAVYTKVQDIVTASVLINGITTSTAGTTASFYIGAWPVGYGTDVAGGGAVTDQSLFTNVDPVATFVDSGTGMLVVGWTTQNTASRAVAIEITYTYEALGV